MEKGDLVYVEYDIWIMPEDEDEEPVLFDTTDEGKAKDEDIFEEDRIYGTRPVVIGEGELLEGFDDALLDAELEEEGSVEVPPEKGIGMRDPGKIELFSRRQLDRKGIDPVVGKEVEIDNRRGTIIQTTAGRVRVDFNHPLAGKTLKYDFKITNKPEEENELIKAVFEKNYGDADIDIEIEGDKLEIVLPERCIYDQNWFVSKYRVVGELRKRLEDIKTIRFVEEYIEKEEEEIEEEELEEELDEDIEEDIEEELEDISEEL